MNLPEANASSAAAYYRSVAECLGEGRIVSGKVHVAEMSLGVNTRSVHITSTAFRIGKEDTIVKWTKYLETEFQNLVSLRAERRASPKDLARLDKIRAYRQKLKNPLKASQILHDFKARELRQKALSAVNAYVQFLEEPASRSKARQE